ncbi:Cys/Met metabolism PLPdependent enzyme superfamily protein [Pelomyxa schiedti]|nr:Cys/Met metabolism PLPdependent enzyme superfamily protein [Pelomyxa schiedti]
MNSRQFERAMVVSSRDGLGYHGAVTPPISLSSTFQYHSGSSPATQSAAQIQRHVYTRDSNPTIDLLERQVAILHGATRFGFEPSSALPPTDAVTVTPAPAEPSPTCNDNNSTNQRVNGTTIPLESVGCSDSASANAETEDDDCLVSGGMSCCVAFASGMAALSAVVCSVCKCGGWVMCSEEIYCDVYTLMDQLQVLAGIHTKYVDFTNLDYTTQCVMEVAADISGRGATKSDKGVVVLLETCSNPNGKVPDFLAVFSVIKSKLPGAVITVDNTWLSPVICQPLQFGADIVVESGTKYLSGKADSVIGVAVVSKSKRECYVPKLRAHRLCFGSCASPMNAWLISKGIETLPLRVERASLSATKIAQFLCRLPCVTRVMHSSLLSHPTYNNYQRYFGRTLYPGVFSFHMPVSCNRARNIVTDTDNGKLHNATSYGEAHTLLEWPTHSPSRLLLEPDNIPNHLGHWFRLAVGLTDPELIISSLMRVFSRHASASKWPCPGTTTPHGPGAPETPRPGDFLVIQSGHSTLGLLVSATATSSALDFECVVPPSSLHFGTMNGALQSLCSGCGQYCVTRLMKLADADCDEEEQPQCSP